MRGFFLCFALTSHTVTHWINQRFRCWITSLIHIIVWCSFTINIIMMETERSDSKSTVFFQKHSLFFPFFFGYSVFFTLKALCVPVPFCSQLHCMNAAIFWLSLFSVKSAPFSPFIPSASHWNRTAYFPTATKPSPPFSDRFSIFSRHFLFLRYSRLSHLPTHLHQFRFY